MEIVQQGLMDFVRISFMVAGHTKFEPDRLFSHIAKAYTSSDVFTTQELATMMSSHAVALVDDGKLVCTWREVLGNKYSKMPGIRDLHDFVIVRHLITGSAMIKVRQHCYQGTFQPGTLKVMSGIQPTLMAIPESNTNYKDSGQTRSLSASKLDHLRQMCANFIPEDRHIPFL